MSDDPRESLESQIDNAINTTISALYSLQRLRRCLEIDAAGGSVDWERAEDHLWDANEAIGFAETHTADDLGVVEQWRRWTDQEDVLPDEPTCDECGGTVGPGRRYNYTRRCPECDGEGYVGPEKDALGLDRETELTPERVPEEVCRDLVHAMKELTIVHRDNVLSVDEPASSSPALAVDSWWESVLRRGMESMARTDLPYGLPEDAGLFIDGVLVDDRGVHPPRVVEDE